MFQLTTRISIGDLFFDYVHEATIKSAWRELTDTAVLQYPRNLFTQDGHRIDDVIAVGQKVSIAAGYDGNTVNRFTGYVSQLNAATHVVQISCEDEMWKLKQSNLTKSWKSTTLDAVIKYVKQQTKATWDYEILGDRVEIGNFKFEKLSAAKVFLKLKEDYGFYCFFRKGKLIVGKPYEPDSSKWTKVNFEYGLNVISWKDLTYKKKSDVLLAVTAVVHKRDGKKKEFKLGDINGEARTLDFGDISDKDAKAQAQELLDKMKYDGYRGKFPAFGEPVISHGDVAVMNDWRYPERAGEFFTDSVETTIKVASIRQVVELGPLASSNVITAAKRKK